MAGSVLSFTGKFDAATRDQANAKRKMSLAVFDYLGTNAQRLTARAELFGAPDFQIEARSDAAETLPLVELISKAVTFPAATGAAATLRYFMRVIEVDAYMSGATAATEQGYIKSRWAVVGGATPVVLISLLPATGSTGVPGVGAGFAGNQFSAMGSTLADTDTPFLTLVAGASTVTLNLVHATVEIMNINAQVRVGKLISLVGGV